MQNINNFYLISLISLYIIMKKILLLITVCLGALIWAKEKHPYHVGSMEFNYNAKTQTFEIYAKFFLDDLENGINKKFGTALHFNDKKFETEMSAKIKEYFMQYVKLKVNNQFLNIKVLGYEEDRESVNVYMESAPIKAPSKVETAVSVLYNLYDDQMNIIHIIVNGMRKSSKLNYPDRYLYQGF